MSSEQFPLLPEFVIQQLREANANQNEGLPSRELLLLCRAEFCDEADRRNQGKEIVVCIKRMVSEGKVKFDKEGDRCYFRLPLDQLAEEEEESGIVVEQRDRDAEEAETSLLEEDTSVENVADRHAAGYAEMIRGARPFVPLPAEGDISTPRKRRRIEIADSESSWNSISPVQQLRRPVSTPRRRQPTPMSPLSGSRRRSAPMQYFSPMKRDTRDYAAEERMRNNLFKHERKDTSPAWMIQGLDVLRISYPDDIFKCTDGKIYCMDCERHFKASSAGNVSNFETHLRSRGHKIVVNKNREAGFCPTIEELEPPKKMIDMNFGEQQMHYQVFAQKSQQNLASLRNQYLAAVESDGHQQSMRLNYLEFKLKESEKATASQQRHFNTVLEASDRSSKDTKEKFNLLSGVIEDTEKRCEDRVQDVVERYDTAELSNAGKMREMEQRVTMFEDQAISRIDETNRMVSRNFQRSTDGLDNLKDQLTKHESSSQTKLDHLTTQITDLREEKTKQDEEIAKLQTQSQNDSQKVENLELQVQQHTTTIQELDNTAKIQENEIIDIQSQSQIHTEELQRQRDSNEIFRKTLTDQMVAHFEETERRISKLLEESQEQNKASEAKMEVRIKGVEEQCAKKIRSLERKNARLGEEVEVLRQMIPAILEDAGELRSYVEEVGKGCEELGRRVLEPKLVARRGHSVRAT